MITLKITKSDWEILKLKLQRKYNHLTQEDLAFSEGQENELITRLAKRLKRTEEYVLFTLSKQQEDLTGNRL